MVPTATTTDVLFHCPSCGTEMCVASEFLTVQGPCIACGCETSAQQALIHAAQQRLMACSAADINSGGTAADSAIPQDEGGFERNGACPEPEVLSTQDLETGDSWLLPCDTLQPEDLATSSPMAQDGRVAQEPSSPQALELSHDSAPRPPVQELESVRMEASVSSVAAAPRNAALQSFGDTSLIDKDFIKNKKSSQLPAPRSEGVSPRLDEVDAPFVPNRVIATSGETDSSWKEKHRRKGRSRRRRRSAEKKIDRLADNPAWGVIRGGLAIAAVLIMAGTIIWIVKNPRGFAAGLQAREKKSLTFEESATNVLAEPQPEQAFSKNVGVAESAEPMDDMILEQVQDEVEPLELSENLDFGY